MCLAKTAKKKFAVAFVAKITEDQILQANPFSTVEQHHTWNFLVPIRTDGDGNPLVLIPGGSGGDNEILLLAGMAGALNTNRDIYAVRSRAMDSSWSHAGTLREHVTAVFAELQQVIAGGSWALIGEGEAVAVAMELACQAQASGLAPETVALLNPFTPPRQPFLARMLGHPNQVSESAVSRRSPQPIRDYHQLVKAHHPGRIRGDLHVILASDSGEPHHVPQYWGKQAQGRLHLHGVRGSQQSYLRCHVAETTTVLNAILFERFEMPHEPVASERQSGTSRA
jgi:thioesterase domain-containing protein